MTKETIPPVLFRRKAQILHSHRAAHRGFSVRSIGTIHLFFAVTPTGFSPESGEKDNVDLPCVIPRNSDFVSPDRKNRKDRNMRRWFRALILLPLFAVDPRQCVLFLPARNAAYVWKRHGSTGHWKLRLPRKENLNPPADRRNPMCVFCCDPVFEVSPLFDL